MQITMRERTVPTAPKRTITAVPTVVSPSDGEKAANTDGAPAAAPAEIAAQAAIRTIGGMVEADTTPQGVDLTSLAVREQVAAAVTQTLAAAGTAPDPKDVEAGVSTALRMINAAMIEIPRITISPGATSMRVPEFELDSGKVQYALRDDRLVYDFVTDRRVRDVKGQSAAGELAEKDIDGYVRKLVGEVAGFNNIDYDGNFQLVGTLCKECIHYLTTKLTAAEMANCMRNNLRSLAESIRSQILEHAKYVSGNDNVDVKPGNLILKANTLTLDAGETPRPFDTPLAPGEKSRIRNMVFTGFRKCLFSLQKFDSDPERAFSELLERDSKVLKWFKPTLSNLRLYYGPNEYTPDFVFETTTGKFLCEVKATTEVNDPTVQAKKEAALKWCRCANDHAAAGAKPWNYLLIPDNCINSSLMLSQAIREFAGIAAPAKKAENYLVPVAEPDILCAAEGVAGEYDRK
jgi:type III restriction enzyme